MANIKYSFLGTELSGTEEHEMQCFLNQNNEIYINISELNYDSHICLDKSTSIKLAKTLRTEINKINGI